MTTPSARARKPVGVGQSRIDNDQAVEDEDEGEKEEGEEEADAQLTEDVESVIDGHDDHVRARRQTTAVKGRVRAGAASVTAAVDPEDNGLRGLRACVKR